MWLIILVWIASLFISTIFMALYVKKYNKSEGIIAIYVIYIALSQVLAVKLAVFWIWTAPAAVLVYPFTYQLTDTINEHFGKKETYKMIIIAFVTQVLMVIFIYFGNSLEPFEYWSIDNDQWNLIFGQQLNIIAASWISFLITGFLDAWLYDKVKKLTKSKRLWVRSILTDVPMLALDSLIFVTLAFGVFSASPNWAMVWTIIVGQVITKWIFGVADTPFIYLDRFIVYGKNLKIEKKNENREEE